MFVLQDGDTALMKAVRNRNVEIVALLLEKRAKVSAVDKNGDTCLHIAMRARSKQIVELLLRNPVHSQLLYRPNRCGETPYNIDRGSPKPILPQIFGHRMYIISDFNAWRHFCKLLLIFNTYKISFRRFEYTGRRGESLGIQLV